MTMTYVFPDLHGRLDHLNAALKAVHEDGITDEDKAGGPVRVLEVLV